MPRGYSARRQVRLPCARARWKSNLSHPAPARLTNSRGARRGGHFFRAPSRLHRIDARLRSGASMRHARRACRCASCSPRAENSGAAGNRQAGKKLGSWRSKPARRSGGANACPARRGPQRIAAIAVPPCQLPVAQRSLPNPRAAPPGSIRGTHPRCTPPRQLGAGNTGNYSRGIPLGITATVRGDARSTDPFDLGILRNCSCARQAD